MTHLDTGHSTKMIWLPGTSRGAMISVKKPVRRIPPDSNEEVLEHSTEYSLTPHKLPQILPCKGLPKLGTGSSDL